MTSSAPERPLPPHVELLVAYTNSEDHELGTDDLTTPAGLSSWLVDHALLPAGSRATHDDLDLARRLRAGLHAALVGHHDGAPDYAGLDDAAADLPLRLSAPGPRDDGAPRLRPVLPGVRGALGEVVVAVNAAVADDTWRRLKVCGADDCRWAYFDASKNRSRAWCEWGCGNKAKTRSYRARQKAARG
jgi:hypothetical protein